MYKKRPVYVRNVTAGREGYLVLFNHISDITSPLIRCSLNSRYLDTTPIKLGFINSTVSMYDREEKISYGSRFSLVLKRNPARKWKVGITDCNTRMSYIKRGEKYLYDIPSINKTLFSVETEQAFMGEYPNIKAIEGSIIENPRKNTLVAFDRKFALSNDWRIFYYQNMAKPIGRWMNKVSLYEEYKYLEEEIGKAL